MKLNPPTNTSLDRLNNFKSHTPQDNEWRNHGTAGVNESFNVRVEINKRPDVPPVAKRASALTASAIPHPPRTAFNPSSDLALVYARII